MLRQVRWWGVAAGEVDEVGVAGFRLDRASYPGRDQIGVHHALHAHRQRHAYVVEPVGYLVLNGSVIEQRYVPFLAGAQQGGLAAHVQERVLLPGKVGRMQVFGRGAAAYCYFNLGRVLGVQVAVAVPCSLLSSRKGKGIACCCHGKERAVARALRVRATANTAVISVKKKTAFPGAKSIL